MCRSPREFFRKSTSFITHPIASFCCKLFHCDRCSSHLFQNLYICTHSFLSLSLPSSLSLRRSSEIDKIDFSFSFPFFALCSFAIFLPISGVNPCCFLRVVIDKVDFSVEISANVPSFGQWLLRHYSLRWELMLLLLLLLRHEAGRTAAGTGGGRNWNSCGSTGGGTTSSHGDTSGRRRKVLRVGNGITGGVLLGHTLMS